jgi:hypothetical protein
MTENQRADRLFLTWLESEAPDQAPEELLDRIDSATRSARPRPAWVARLEGHHMEIIEGGRRSGAPSLGLIVAVVVIAIAALAGAAFVGTRLVQPPVAPTPSQPAVLTVPSAAPASSAKAPASTPALPAPAALQGRWRAEIAPSVAILTFTATGFTINWLSVHSGRIEVEGDEITFSGNRDPQCPDGGTYRWSIEGDKLHFEPVGTDPCPFQAQWAGNRTYTRWD